MLAFLRFFSVASLAVVASACTTVDPDTMATTHWHIVPDAAVAETKVVTPGDTVIRQRLVPNGMAVLGEDFRLNPGSDRNILRAGEKLALSTRGKAFQIYCSISPLREKSGLEEAWLIGEIHVCFEDSDDDSRFDTFYEFMPDTDGIISMSEKLGKPQPTDVSYTVVDPLENESGLHVSVIYAGKPLLYNRRNFHVEFGRENETGKLSSFVYTKGNDYPQTVNLNGSAITVLSEEQGALTVRIDKPMSGPFAVYTVTTYRTIYY